MQSPENSKILSNSLENTHLNCLNYLFVIYFFLFSFSAFWGLLFLDFMEVQIIRDSWTTEIESI